jgi:hypothetical protein
MAVAAVERAEIVDVEEHKRESLLSTEGWKRGDEFAAARESGQTIHVSIIGAAERRLSPAGPVFGMTPERAAD